jgi:hypothetical protein
MLSVYSGASATPFPGSRGKEIAFRKGNGGPVLRRWRERRKVLELARLLAELDALAARR